VYRILIVLSTVFFFICVIMPTDGIGFDQKNWNGSIVVTITTGDTSTASSGKKTSSDGKGELTCQFSGVGSNAACSYSSHYIIQGPGGFITTDKSANNVPVDVQVAIANGKLKLAIGIIPVTVDMKSSVIALGSEKDSVTFEDYIVPASKDPDNQVGSWTDASLPGMTTTIQWNIRSVSQASASAPRKPGKLPDDEPKDASLTFEACTELGVGQQGTATATGKPAGGTYQFWAEPSSALQVTGQGSTAKLRGSEPGRGTLYVRYTAPNGKTRQASKSATSFLLESINGGQPIPQIGLVDETGKRTENLIVPVSVKPDGAGDLVVYKPADPAVLTVANQGDSIVLQGVHEGKTTVQGTTQCGGPTGPTVTLEVVRCTDQTINKMLEKEKRLEDRLKMNIRKAQELTADPDLKKAEKEVVRDTADAWLKASEVVLAGAGLVTKLDHAAHALEHAVSGVNAGISGWSGLQGNSEAMIATAALLNPLTSTMAVEYEVYHSWHKWIEDLKKIGSTVDEVSDLADQYARDYEELQYQIDRREKICGKWPRVPSGSSSTSPPASTPPQNKAHTSDQRPSTQTTSSEAQTSEAQTTKTDGKTSDTDVIADPPFEPPPSQSGGFIIPQECGCGSDKTGRWGSNAVGLGAMSGDLARTTGCGEKFEAGVEVFGQDLKVLRTAVVDVQQALGLSKEQGLPRVQAAVPIMKSSIAKIQGFVKSAESVKPGFGSCEETFQKAGTLLSAAPDHSGQPVGSFQKSR
jgi:hypothetical protein